MGGTLQRVEHAVLGFDAREMLIDPGVAWDQARREQYLLRMDVRKPLSVDCMVWPSLFGPGLPELERQRLGHQAMQFPSWKGPNQDLWDDLSRMQGALGPLAAEPHWTVAISWVSTDGFAGPPGGAGPYRETMTPSTISEDWKLLGFDVADAGFISGLSNCGYGEDEVTVLRATWASLLNQHHLFTDVKDALAFKLLTDARVPEHAPFFVYGLTLIARISSKPSFP
jgi:hypothetical protein